MQTKQILEEKGNTLCPNGMPCCNTKKVLLSQRGNTSGDFANIPEAEGLSERMMKE